jgi:hypothetical protein
MSLPYPLLCALLGLALGWVPALLHGPIAEKYDLLYLRGTVAVSAWYTARLSIGLLVGMTSWPRPWWVRGPLCGLLALLPLGLVSVATPGCGLPCMFWNEVTAMAIGAAVAGIAYGVTGKHHALDGAGA